MIEKLIFLIVLFAFLIASFEDIRKREVYDYINFSLAFFILVVGIFDSLISESFASIIYVTFGMLVGFSIGASLFYFGVWGGGDAKFLIGFSGSAFYLMGVYNGSLLTPGLYGIISQLLLDYFQLFLKNFLYIILILDLIFLFLIFYQFFFVRDIKTKKNLLFLFLVLGFLFLGLYFRFEGIYLSFIGFLVFVMIFMANEGTFSGMFVSYKKHLKDLVSGDKLVCDLRVDSKLLVPLSDGIKGISKEKMHDVREFLRDNPRFRKFDVRLRLILPFVSLLTLNFVVYLLKIISIDRVNLEVLTYLFKFLFFSFMAGGILAVFVVFYYYVLNFKKVKLNVNKYEWFAFSFVFLTMMGLYQMNSDSLLLLLLWPLYFFVKVAKGVEKFAFIKKKPLENITLGDWITQDIKDGHKLIYSAEDFKIGVDELQLAKIKELAKKHKSLENIEVKDGIPFLPALFFGFLMMFLL